LWQVSQLLAHANDLAESVKRALAPDVPPSATPQTPTATGELSKK
jgi:hypothetical protein